MSDDDDGDDDVNESEAASGRRVTKAEARGPDGPNRKPHLRLFVGRAAHRLSLREAVELFDSLRVAVPHLISLTGPCGTPGMVPAVPAVPAGWPGE